MGWRRLAHARGIGTEHRAGTNDSNSFTGAGNYCRTGANCDRNRYCVAPGAFKQVGVIIQNLVESPRAGKPAPMFFLRRTQEAG